jgi:uncharacterized protein (TIGR01244 family)
MRFYELDRQVLVADDQVRAADLEEAVTRDVTLIVNNRPDGEEADQPTAVELEAAAKAAGLDFVHIPVTVEFSSDKIEALDAALTNAKGRVLLFCRSGTRSTYLWALARARAGADPAALVQSAARAGYNIRPIMAWLKPGQD